MARLTKNTWLGLLRLFSAALTPLLGMFCRTPGGDPQPVYGVAPEYGVPQAEYYVSGTVRDAGSSSAIPGILMSLHDTANATQPIDTARTDSAGRYELYAIDVPRDIVWRLRATDTDGSKNGSYAQKDTSVNFTEGDVINGEAGKSIDIPLDPTVP
jgi:putative lipoprotein (rSAM/lipoprotein system)